MVRALLTLENVDLSFGGDPLLAGASLAVAEGERIGLVGRNGSGKSTLLRVAAGLVEPESGERFQHPAARVAYLAQEADFGGAGSALAYVEAQLGPLDDPALARRLLDEFAIAADADPARLSGGEARRVALAGVLAPLPDVLLLDEPTNHLDLPAIEWLERHLAGLRVAIVLISHDRRFLESLARTTVWLDRGRTRRLEQAFTAFEDWRDDLLEQEEIERHKLDRKIAREQQWMHGGVTGRRKRNVRRVRELADLRREKREARPVLGNAILTAAESDSQAGRLVIEARELSKSFAGEAVIAGVSVRIARGDRVGIVGPNGAGKTTLLKLLTGELAPDAGSLRLGTNIEMALLDQHRDALQPDWTLADVLTGGRGDQVIVNGHARHVVGYMRDFLFSADQARTSVSVLSGGERARLLLARLLARPSNLLVLDEPTNDLDLETLDLLQEMLAAYPGTVLLVSHDRDFLDRVVTSVLASDGQGRWIEYAGGYSDMLAQRLGKPEASARPGESRKRAAQMATPAAALPRRKLSFKDKHALESLPAEIERLTHEGQALEAKISDATLYARDRSAFDAATAALAAKRTALAAAEDRWLELELLRGEIEG